MTVIADLAGKTVLVAEDEAFVALDLEDALFDSGANVIGPFARLGSAVEALDATLPDAAILDIDLAGTDVFPLADLLRERQIPFLFHTGHGQRSELAEKYPATLVCKKPVPPDVIVQAVSDLLKT